jgi:hypothetical protein
MAATPLEASYHRGDGVRMTSVESAVPYALFYEKAASFRMHHPRRPVVNSFLSGGNKSSCNAEMEM